MDRPKKRTDPIMTDAGWDKVGALFEQAWAAPPEEQAAFLEAHCEDEAVRQEVAALLDAHEAFGFFEDLAAAVIPRALSELQQAEEQRATGRDPLALEGKQVDRYAVEEHLGGGGMGVVYKARDTRLGRTIALKFLPPHLAAHPEAEERFVREARAASSLDHPHIATIHEIDRTEKGRRFIAMAYYEGETLKKKIARGPLPVEEALDYAAQIAEGLRAVHAAGIVHRDVKPANVIVTEHSTAKLLDFGLARVADQSQLTRPGTRMGTAAYMSPEQARGEAVDARTDLWALGVVLYEMLVGKRPFRGARDTAVVYAILNEEPTPAGRLRDEVLPALERVIRRLLAKDRAARYPAARELLGDLQALRTGDTSALSGIAATVPDKADRSWRLASTAARMLPRRALRSARRSQAWVLRYGAAALLLGVVLAFGVSRYLGTGEPKAPVNTLAVLPFNDLSANGQNRSFVDGMTEDVLTNLAQIGDLRVTARTSVMPYRETDKSIPEIADELDVDYLLEGSVRRAASEVRITTQLVDATEGMQVWSASYDRRLEDLFAVQSDIAKAIAGELEAELAPVVAERIERAPTDDLEAYQLFLRGREYWGRGTKEDNETGIDLLRRAVKRDPDFALARATLAKAYARDAWAFGASAQWADSAVAEAERAIALAPDLAEAHGALGKARMAAGRFTEAAASYERAIELNPNYWGAVNDLSIVYLQTGRLAQAIRQWKRAAKGNPAFAYGHRFNLALAYRVLGLLDRAEQGNRAALALKPDHVLAIVNQAHVDLFQGDMAAVTDAAEQLASDHGSNPYALQSAGWLLIFAGELERARAPLERAYALSPTASGEGYVRVRLGYALWQVGERERAERLFEEFERFAAEQIEKGNEYSMLPYSLAAAHAVRGGTEQALRWLERAVEAGWPYELTTARDPLLASLRGEERFQTLVDRMRERNAEMRRRLAQAEEQERAGWLLPE